MLILYGIFKLKQDKYSSPYFIQTNDIILIKTRLKELDQESTRREFVSVFPQELKGLAGRAVSPNESQRPDLNEIRTNPWFSDNLVKGIYYLENFYTLPEQNKNTFLSSLVKTVGSYSADIVEKRIIPFINNNMIQPTLVYNLTILALVICEKNTIQPADHKR